MQGYLLLHDHHHPSCDECNQFGDKPEKKKIDTPHWLWGRVHIPSLLLRQTMTVWWKPKTMSGIEQRSGAATNRVRFPPLPGPWSPRAAHPASPHSLCHLSPLPSREPSPHPSHNSIFRLVCLRHGLDSIRQISPARAAWRKCRSPLQGRGSSAREVYDTSLQLLLLLLHLILNFLPEASVTPESWGHQVLPGIPVWAHEAEEVRADLVCLWPTSSVLPPVPLPPIVVVAATGIVCYRTQTRDQQAPSFFAGQRMEGGRCEIRQCLLFIELHEGKVLLLKNHSPWARITCGSHQ